MFFVCGSGRLLVAVALVWAWLLLGFVACRLWSALCVLFLSCGVHAWRRKGTDPKTGNDLCSLYVRYPLLFDVLGLLFPASEASRVGGTLGCVLRDGSDGWRSPVSRGDNTGGEVLYFFRQPSVSVPPTGSEPRDGFSFWVCSGTSIPSTRGVAASVSDALLRQPSSSSTSLRRLRLGVAAQASGTSLRRCFRYSRR